MTKDEVKGLFAVAGIEVLALWRRPNQYHFSDDIKEVTSDVPANRLMHILNAAWWLVLTPAGLVEVGRRKRVTSINWKLTPVRAIVTEDDVTKDSQSVHAWSLADAVRYLSALGRHFAALPPERQAGTLFQALCTEQP